MERDHDARRVMESTPIDTILCTKTAGPRWTGPAPASQTARIRKQQDCNRMNTRSKLIVATATFCAARFAFALSPGEAVDNFRLLDHQGGSRELYYLSDMKAVVLMAHAVTDKGNGCEGSRQAVPGLKALRDQYRSQGVEFLLIDSNLPDTSAAIVKE